MSGPLSVVIAAHDAETVIETCLAALEAQCLESGVEVIVADSSLDATPRLVASRFPWVRLLHFDEPLPIQVLRGQGIRVAGGAVIAILDPYSVAATDWVAQAIAAHADRPDAVIGGSVGLYRAASCSIATWALYLYEYGLFMPPAARGPTWIVPGNNVTYKREALFDGETPRYPVFWKTFANWEIERARTPLWLEPAMRVDLHKPIPVVDFLRTRYHHGRCFAAMRVSGASSVTRLVRALSTPLVPGLLLWRWTLGIWPKRQNRGRYVLAMPALFLLFSVWSWGEACGYLFGTEGTCDQLFY